MAAVCAAGPEPMMAILVCILRREDEFDSRPLEEEEEVRGAVWSCLDAVIAAAAPGGEVRGWRAVAARRGRVTEERSGRKVKRRKPEENSVSVER